MGYSNEKLDNIITNYLKENNSDLVKETYFGKAIYYKNDGKLYVSFSSDEDNFMSILLN